MSRSAIPAHAVAALAARETARFLDAHPRCTALAKRAADSLFGGVPMHWMTDWPTPCPLFVREAQGARLADIDGNEYVDFCLGDTGAMFGHSPAPIARALAEQGSRGLTTMLPGEDAVVAAELLAARFGLPFWQVATTATDANRFVIRWARAITRRPVILVFDGCYHGSVDDTMVRLREGRVLHRPGSIGQLREHGASTRVVPFNDPGALEAALAPGDVAAVLCEPAMTNIGMVLPQPGFMATLRSLTRAEATLLVVDETHTISVGQGGCTRAWGLEPDMLTLGKPVAGGVPYAVYGTSADVAAAMHRARQAAGQASAGHGHSGMGTTLSANALAMRCLRVCLAEVMTDAAYRHMLALSGRLAGGLRALIARHRLDWSVTELGARCEFQFRAQAPLNGAEAQSGFDHALEAALHLYLLNRGILITPFHNMTLCCPATRAEDVERLVATLDRCISELLAEA